MAAKAISKAGRNEARKLTASAVNNIGVAFALAGVLQPAIAFVQMERMPTLAVSVGSLIFIAVAAVVFAMARRIVRGLED